MMMAIACTGFLESLILDGLIRVEFHLYEERWIREDI